MRFILVAAVAFLLACGGSGAASITSPPPIPVAPGSWTLVELNSSPLPTTIYVFDRVSAGTMVLRADATYTESFNAVGSAGVPITLVENGTWTGANGSVVFKTDYGPSYGGTVAPNGDLATTGGRYPTQYHKN